MNYVDTFIATSEDCSSAGAEPPRGKASVARVQYEMLVEQAYRFTQEDVLLASSAGMREDSTLRTEEARAAFFSRPQACLRCSPLVKKFGWGIHFDAEGRAAAVPVGSEEYRRWEGDAALTQTKGMRSKRGG